MPVSDPEPSKLSPRRRPGRWLFLIALAVMASTAAILAPYWTPFTTGNPDENAIAFERAERHWRATWGLPLRGTPDLANISQRLSENGLTEGAPILIRIFKREFELELWMKRDGVFHRFSIYPICRWSGALGPKTTQGDHQAPEGFYSVDANALNPNSRWHRSFNLGFPNALDRSLGRSGSLIMVHGGCASIGCFAMTNGQIDEIWRLVTAALNGGQKRFQVQVYPFRMTDEALARRDGQPNAPFWRDLKRGNDLFEANLLPPRVLLCQGRYRFEGNSANPDGDSEIEARCPSVTPKS